MPFSASNYLFVEQFLEGARVADFMWGTPNARQMVIRFDFECSVDTYFAVAVHNAASDRSFVSEQALQYGGGQSYPKTFTIVVPGDTAGTWVSGNAASIGIAFVLAVGSTYQTATPGIWLAGNYLGTAQVTSPQTNTNHIVTRIGVYLDTYKTGVAPP